MRILLVDDDVSVIQTFLAVLKSMPGQEVRVAMTGEKALENAASMGGIDLLITDAVMEPMDGFTLRDEILARYPQARVMFITGYDLSEYAERLNGHTLLQKPFDPAEFIAAVERELAEVVPAAPVAVTRHAVVPPPTALVREAIPARPSQPRATVKAAVAAPRVVATPRAVPSPAALAEESPPETVWATTQPPPPPSTTPASATDELVGQMIGAYQITSRLGESRWGAVYSAVQIAINRPVGLKVLDPARAADEPSRQRFIADARAKANVQHPSILAVYEAGESEGLIFYAHEYVDGQNLAQMAEHGRKVDEPVALKILRVTAEGLGYLHQNNVPHTPLDASQVYVGTDGHVRLGNLATQHSDQQVSVQEEIIALGRAMFAIIHTGPNFTQALRTLLNRMIKAQTSGLNSWEEILQAVKAIEPKVVPLEAAQIDAQDRAAIAAVEAARREQKKAILQYVIGSISLVAIGVWVVWMVIRNNERVVEELVAIPAGSYSVGSQKVTLPAFWIDKYEVTVGQYAKFLAFLEANPGSSKDFDHPKQPRHLESHTPPNWRIFYERAKAGKPVHSAPYSLDSPVVEVTWWDAYAYARWRGRELPTEAQWEAAARGAAGQLYPWGSQFDASKVNAGTDFNAGNPGAKGTKDGWNFWNPVDAVPGDKSSFGVIGMAGNVSEWVADASADGRLRVLKGGNYMSKDVPLDKRVADQDPNKGEEHIGFRTATTKPPAPPK